MPAPAPVAAPAPAPVAAPAPAPAADAVPADTGADDADEHGGKHHRKHHKHHGEDASGEDHGTDAEPTATDDTDDGDTATDADHPAKAGGAQHKDTKLEVSGRVYARATAYDDDINPWIGALSIPSARVGVTYQWKDKVAAKVSFEVKGSLRDAYVDVALTPCLTLRAGRFKLPASGIERTSTWTLPTIDRTVLSDVLGGSLGAIGRRVGAQLTWKYDAGLHPKVEAAVAQAYDLNGDLLARPLSDGMGAIATLHGELRPAEAVKVGAFVQDRTTDYPGGSDQFWTGGVDLAVEQGGLRIWADGFGGTSHFALKTWKEADQPFVAGQLIAGWRAGGRKQGKRYLEPFVLAAYLNPDTGHKHDDVSQVGGGLSGGRWKRWRAQVEAVVQSTAYHTPPGIGGYDKAAGINLDDRTTIEAQLSAAF
ncbi:MAG TPA: porin [Kofleriaceae bacterium]|nr:porin [Kofleriaceae bacterium]